MLHTTYTTQKCISICVCVYEVMLHTTDSTNSHSIPIWHTRQQGGRIQNCCRTQWNRNKTWNEVIDRGRERGLSTNNNHNEISNWRIIDLRIEWPSRWLPITLSSIDYFMYTQFECEILNVSFCRWNEKIDMKKIYKNEIARKTVWSHSVWSMRAMWV